MRVFARNRRFRRAAVLGCGPAGLFAAHGLVEAGYTVWILSKKRKSHLYGAQYLHAPVPGLTPVDADPIEITYRLEGDVEGYRQKVYGAMPVKVSPEALDMKHQGWDLRATYDAAWDRFQDDITHAELSPDALRGGGRLGDWDLSKGGWDLIVNTVPLTEICYQRDLHQFHAARVWAYGDAPALGQLTPFRPEPGMVECNGTRDTGWYRASNIYGHATIEWPLNRKPPLSGVAEVTKPIYTDCNCYRDGSFPIRFVSLGRYGQWQKGVLTHHAYTQAVQL